MLGDPDRVTGTYPDVIGGGGVPFSVKARPKVTDEVLDHIVIGTPTRRGGCTGGHGAGQNGWPNFPADWNRQRISDAVSQVLSNPPDLRIERKGATLYFGADIGGIPIIVRVKGRTGTPRIWTAYPDPNRVGE